jgi:cell division protein FtsI/penicillin-binding protein 2/type II secretory pathway pseudopilin PulG
MPLSTWSTRRRTLVAVAAVLVLALIAAAVVVQQRWAREQRLDAAARTAAQAFADRAQRRDLPEPYTDVVAGLGDVRPSVQVLAVRREGTAGTADLRWTWPFGPEGWTYDTSLPLSAGADDAAPWIASVTRPAVHPALQPDGVLHASRVPAKRGQIRGRGGAPLVTATPVVDVGVQPSRATDPAALSRALGDLLDVDAAALQQRITRAAPDAFVPVITLRRSDYEPLKSRLQPLAGTVFREAMRPLAPTREFARALLGTAGPVTAEVVEQSGGRLTAGDIAGLSGVQRAFDERLGGTAGVTVEQVRGEQRSELFSVPPVAGQPVELTIDPRVQKAADAALSTARGGNGNASLVAIDVQSGDLVAIANTPANGANRALTGQYPPGSTFKAVSALALLGTELTQTASVPCPPTATVEGRSFRNFEGSALGSVPFRTAFAQSCNTAFVSLSDRLQPPALPAAGRAAGLGVNWSVGVDVFAGDVPAPATPVELAAATIGQGRVLASPAAMAQVAATVARGSWAPPRLVVDPAPDADTPPPPAVDPARLATVRELMRQVVVDGTASALNDVPGPPVHAKTGTAEYGTESPPRTHAWTIGLREGLAFAVLVEDGRSGGEVAVPVAEAFLRAL